MRAPCANGGERGFTLIEVLIAMVVFTVAMVALAELMAITLRMQMLGRNQTSAVRLAQSKLDELISFQQQDWAGAPQIAIGGSLSADVSNYNDTPVVGYRRRWVVADVASDPGSDPGDLRMVTVRVIPDVRDSRVTAAVELVTFLRNPAQ